jgi:hypothetical protein
VEKIKETQGSGQINILQDDSRIVVLLRSLKPLILVDYITKYKIIKHLRIVCRLITGSEKRSSVIIILKRKSILCHNSAFLLNVNTCPTDINIQGDYCTLGRSRIQGYKAYQHPYFSKREYKPCFV